MLYGDGAYRYELVEGWTKCPEGWTFLDVSGLAIDSKDRIYAFNRGAHPLMVFDQDGKYLAGWGEGYDNQYLPGAPFQGAHGIHVDRAGCVYLTDGHHLVRKYNPEGKLLLQLGHKDRPSDTGYVTGYKGHNSQATLTIKRASPPFNLPLGVAVSSSGEIFVCDGYGNACVHRFAPDGTLLQSWGEPGEKPGQFRDPHAVCIDRQDRVWVADRENNRIQIFDTQGKLLDIWTDVLDPCGIAIDKAGTVYICETFGAYRVSIFNADSQLITRFGKRILGGQLELGADRETALFIAPHAIAVDSRGDLYVGCVSQSSEGFDRGPRNLQKFRRVA